MKNVTEPVKSFFDKVLQWLSQVLPTAVTVGSIIYRYMARRILQKENQIEELELDNKLHENRKEVADANKNKSDADIIDDAIREGEQLGNNSGESSGS